MPDHFTAADLVRLSGTAIGRINREGARGTTMVTDEQIEAMAALLLILGVPPIDRSTPPAAIAAAIAPLIPRLEGGLNRPVVVPLGAAPETPKGDPHG